MTGGKRGGGKTNEPPAPPTTTHKPPQHRPTAAWERGWGTTTEPLSMRAWRREHSGSRPPRTPSIHVPTIPLNSDQSGGSPPHLPSPHSSPSRPPLPPTLNARDLQDWHDTSKRHDLYDLHDLHDLHDLPTLHVPTPRPVPRPPARARRGRPSTSCNPRGPRCRGSPESGEPKCKRRKQTGAGRAEGAPPNAHGQLLGDDLRRSTATSKAHQGPCPWRRAGHESGGKGRGEHSNTNAATHPTPITQKPQAEHTDKRAEHQNA